MMMMMMRYSYFIISCPLQWTLLHTENGSGIGKTRVSTGKIRDNDGRWQHATLRVGKLVGVLESNTVRRKPPIYTNSKTALSRSALEHTAPLVSPILQTQPISKRFSIQSLDYNRDLVQLFLWGESEDWTGLIHSRAAHYKFPRRQGQLRLRRTVESCTRCPDSMRMVECACGSDALSPRR
jgi:hypothetical protein